MPLLTVDVLMVVLNKLYVIHTTQTHFMYNNICLV